MKNFFIGFIFLSALPIVALADPISEFDAALAKWQSAKINSCSFVYEYGGGVLVAPKCARTKIKVVVRNGVSSRPIVVKGHAECSRGTQGEKSIELTVPKSIDAAFAEMRRYIHNPPTPAEIYATYDPQFGIPLTYSALKMQIPDNDEGFRISDFKVLKE